MQQQQIQKVIGLARSGDLPGAIRRCRSSAQRSPEDVDVWMLLGNLYLQENNPLPALESFRRAATLAPSSFEAHYNIAVLLRQRGSMPESANSFRRAWQCRPDSVPAVVGLSMSLADSGDLEEAEQVLTGLDGAAAQAIEVNHQLAMVTMRREKFADAERYLKQVISLKPDFREAWNNLGMVLVAQRRYPEAEQVFRKALSCSPGYSTAHYNLGDVLAKCGKVDEAIEHYLKIPAGDQVYPRAQNNLGVVLMDERRFEAAEEAFNKARTSAPDYADPYNNLGFLAQTRGDYDLATECYRKALDLGVNFVSPHSNLLVLMNYSRDYSPHDLLEESRRWETLHANWLGGDAYRFGNNPDPGRRIRIGYVSPDFRRHSVAAFIEPVLEAHDPDGFDVYCYANVNKVDDITRRLQQVAMNWRDISGMRDNKAAALVRADEIDILVDLAGHTAGNSLGVFALKPAPVCISYLGYPATTGLQAMDYRITDEAADPESIGNPWCVEELLRIPGGFLCYRPLDSCPAISEYRDSGPGVTFGCFNNSMKISTETLSMWAEILNRLPRSGLLLKSKWYAQLQVRDRILTELGAQGIRADRIEFLEHVKSDREHLDLYNRVDIALDTSPYNGTTTTCEALWMGVPVIVLEGDRHAGRVGMSLLRAIGHEELVAHSPEDYVEAAVQLAGNRDRLSGYHQSLRDTMASSDLMNPGMFVSRLEAAYRSVWRKYCESRA